VTDSDIPENARELTGYAAFGCLFVVAYVGFLVFLGYVVSNLIWLLATGQVG